MNATQRYLVRGFMWVMSGLSVAGWAGIAVAQPPSDLVFTGVSIADYKNEANTDLLGKHMALGDALLKVTFTSRTDLGKLAFEKEMLISDAVRFCEQTEEGILGSWVDVFRGEFSVNAVRADRRVRAAYLDAIAKQPYDEPITYHIYVGIRQGPRSVLADGRTVHIDPYDLASAPRDVCVRILGRRMLGGGFASNVVVVPAAALRRAIGQK
ncbi:MAG: hypothetical protein E6H60_11985 [Betaproteobacteria bacterium]|nr:MAG: hypothetical protein E6H60_11985 [Betaproteobacteria bacterium]